MSNATARGIDQRYSGRFAEPVVRCTCSRKIDAKRFNIHDDQKMVLTSVAGKVLLVQGRYSTGRPTTSALSALPRVDDIELSLSKFARFLVIISCI